MPSLNELAPGALDRWIKSHMDHDLIAVRFLTRNGWVEEHHIDDPLTLFETIRMTCDRLPARYAVYKAAHAWKLVRSHAPDDRTYKTREAAEMVAIHGA